MTPTTYSITARCLGKLRTETLAQKRLAIRRCRALVTDLLKDNGHSLTKATGEVRVTGGHLLYQCSGQLIGTHVKLAVLEL